MTVNKGSWQGTKGGRRNEVTINYQTNASLVVFGFHIVDSRYLYRHS